jgi:Carboxypeptidase regulatory-like domain
MTTFRYLASSAAACALISAFSTGAYAQQTTGAIRGAAATLDGKPVAGATIVVTHTPSGTRSVLVTDASGAFDVRGLRVGGPYRILAKAAGFDDQILDNVYLTVGDAQQVSLALVEKSRVSDVVVTAARSKTTALVANVGSKTTLRHGDIEEIVSPKRDLRDIGRRDPLAELDFVTRSTGPTGGLYIAGSSPRSNRITIDGVRSQDDYGLNTGGLSTNRGPVSLEALEQVAIQAVPFDVEDGDFTGGALNLITRSGTNTFHGSVFGFTRTGRDVGTQLPIVGFPGGDVTKPPLGGYTKVRNKIHESNEGLFLSGPILKDKLFFAASWEKFDSIDLTSAGPLGGGFANTFNAIPGISTGSGATAADIATALSGWNGYAASSNLSPGSVALTKPITDEKSSIKIDYNISDTQRLTASYRHAYSSVYKRSPSSTSISLDTNWYNQPENEDNYILQLNSKWNSQLSTEARVAFRGYQRGQLPPEGQGFSQFSVCGDVISVGSTFSCSSGVPTIAFGPDQFRQANVLKTTDTAAGFVANYRLNDDHLVKVGVQYKNIHVFNLFLQQAHGVYYFDSVADFAAGKANQLSFGNSLTGTATDAAARFSYSVTTLFAQDTWDVMRGLTVNYGLRDDIYSSGVKPTLNNNFVGRYSFGNQTTYDGVNVLMPRVSAKWRTETFELSGGIGLVSGGVPDVFLGNSYGATTGALTNAIAVRRQANGTFLDVNTNTVIDNATGSALLNLDKTNAGLANNPAAIAQTLITADSANRRTAFTNSLAPGFDMPADWKANLSFKTTKWGFDFALDAVMTRSQTTVAFRDLRARLLTVNGVQQLTPDGRLRYDGLNVSATNRAAQGLPIATNTDLTNLGLNGDIQAYNPGVTNTVNTAAFSVGRNLFGVQSDFTYMVQQGSAITGVSEFGTTAGGNGTSGNYFADQTFSGDPNGAAKGRPANLIKDAYKVSFNYKREFWPGFLSTFTLFGEDKAGRPISFLMTDPNGNRNPTFGVSRDDALVYVPNLSSCVTTGALPTCTTGSTTVYFDSTASLNKFKALVQKFNLPQGQIVPKGFGRNPRVNRFDFQFAQEIPGVFHGDKLLFTIDIANVGNLLNRHWGVVKEYSNSRAGGVVVNAQCADASGVAVKGASAVCASYLYNYQTANAATLATPIVDTNSLYSVVFGLKYKF